MSKKCRKNVEKMSKKCRKKLMKMFNIYNTLLYYWPHLQPIAGVWRLG
jgi:hypothetical protein